LTTMAAARADASRQLIRLVILKLDQCGNEYGVAPCTASGGRCAYTWPTCKDTANYTQSTYNYKFTNRGAPSLLGALPLLLKFDPLGSRILQDKFEVSAGEWRLKFAPDTAAPLVCVNKTTSEADVGSFWPNLIARNPNYQGRMIKVYEGYAGVLEADFELMFSGTIENITVSRDGAEIMARDLLYKAKEAKLPAKIDESNTVYVTLAIGGATLEVVDAAGFLDASAKHPRIIKIESEYITYTGRNTTLNTLTGLGRGAYGTSAAQHVAGLAIAQVLAYGNAAFTAGIAPDLILYDLLYLSGIGAGYWEVADDGCVLNEALDNSETAFDVTGGNYLPDAGVIRIDDEWCAYTTRTDTLLSGIVRGVWGTTAVAHDTAAIVYISTCSSEVNRWHAGATFRRKVEKETSIGELVKTLAADNMADVFVNESGKIAFSIQAPPVIGTDVSALTRDDHWRNSRKVNFYDESRCTRVYLFHSAPLPDPGETPENYGALRVYYDADAEAAVNYGKAQIKTRYCPWIYQAAEANWLAVKLFNRYKKACPILTFSLETYYASIRLGDLLRLIVPEIVGETGAAVSKLYKVTCRDPKEDNEIVVEATDTGYGDDRYGLIAPAMGTLVTAIDNDDTFIYIEVGDTVGIGGSGRLTAADFRTGGQIRIGDEKITIGEIYDDVVWPLSTPKVALLTCVRGALGTTPDSHEVGDQVLILYSGASDDFRRRYAFIGDSDNLLDSDGDGTADEAGYVIF